MSSADHVTNVVIAGLGGQGVLKASDILADALFLSGRDVKKSEIHGMSQRGGSVTSDVRFGPEILSPMVPAGEADYLVAVSPDQLEPNRSLLRDGGVLICPAMLEGVKLGNPRSLNVALLGVLSAWLDAPRDSWLAAIRANLPKRLHRTNLAAFESGREAGIQWKKGDQP